MCVGKVLSRDLTQQLNNAIQFLVHCRPLSISMGNAIKYVKLQASHLLSCAYQLSCISKAFCPPAAVYQHGQRHQIFQAAGKSAAVFCISNAFWHPAAVYQRCHQVCQASGKSSADLCISKAVCHSAAVYQQCHQVCQAAGKTSTVFCISKAVCHLAAVYQRGQSRQVCQAACESSVAVSRPKSACHTFERERLYSFHIKLLCCCKETMCTVKALLELLAFS